ncbi:unnamed protein product, partial [Brachionus calyciflorus]
MNATLLDNNQKIFTFLSTISIAGTIGNLAVVIVYWKKKDKQTSTFFILILAFSDLAVCSVLVPLTFFMEKIFFETESLLLCKTFFFLTTTIVPSSSLLMSAIAFDRYFCICKVSKNIMNLNKARVVVSLILIISFLTGVIPLLSSVVIKTNSNLSNENYLCIVDQDSTYTTFGFLITPFKFFYDFIYAASVITITVLYILIYKEIYSRSKIKRIRKKEILYNSIISHSENGIFPETLLIKNQDFKNDSIDQNRVYLLRECCIKLENSESLKDLAKFRIENLNERKEFLKNYSQIKSKNRKFLSDVLPTNEKEQDYINDNISQATLNSESNLKKKFKKKNKTKCHQNRKLKKKKINL